jgi:5'-nucleotidase
MRSTPLNRRVAAGFVSVMIFAVAPAPAFGQATTLGILLTGDDGFEAPGLLAMKAALEAAGDRVSVLAPLDDRGGVGTAHTTRGTIDYYRQEQGVWAIDGTPSDAVTLGLVHVLRETPPDLVIAGLDFGQNVGANVVGSGNIGAALTAARAGVPAIAASVAVDLDEAASTPPYGRTVDAYGPAADLVVEIVRQLAETGGRGLLPPRAILNVNYPAVGAAAPTGISFAPLSSRRAFRQVYSVAGDSGPATVQTIAADPSDAEGGTDLALLSAGHVTLSVLDGDWDVGEAVWEELRQRLVIER